jgi:hypothetical protein
MKRAFILLGVCLLFSMQADAQKLLKRLGNSVKEAATNTVERRVEQKAEEATESALDKAEDKITGSSNSKSKEEDIKNETPNEEKDVSVNTESTAEETQQKLSSTSKYDFVPGDKIIYYDDFSQDAIGDFPALWTSNGSGEVKTVNIAPGNWFHMNGEDAVYCYTKELELPDNFIVEFDIIPDEEYRYGIQFTL